MNSISSLGIETLPTDIEWCSTLGWISCHVTRLFSEFLNNPALPPSLYQINRVVNVDQTRCHKYRNTWSSTYTVDTDRTGPFHADFTWMHQHRRWSRKDLCRDISVSELSNESIATYTAYSEYLPGFLMRQHGTWWRIGWVHDFQLEGRGFNSRSSRHVRTLGKSFTYNCLCAYRRETQ